MARRRKSNRLSKAVVLSATVVLISIALGVGLLSWNLLSDSSSPARPKAAAIVDQLSLTQPNPSFAETATSMLEQAGYTVDYYPGEEVTVDFWRNLPTHGYGLLILRVHSGLARDAGEPTDYVSLFTGEPFSATKHYEDAEAGRLSRARYYDGGPEYFAIVPDFIDLSMAGRFDDTIVILMGCDGLTSDSAAEAFVHKGAKAVVGWSGRVSATHTDAATERLLQHLLAEEYTTREAVLRTMADVGPDPEYDSTLLVYPSKG
jgi:hypothetical protein